MRVFKRQIGIGLLELMLVLALIAVILVLALSYYQVANRTHLVNKGFNDIQAVASGAQSWWTDNNHNFKNLKDIKTLIDKGYLGENFATNPWGGTTTIVGLNADEAKISMANVEEKACHSLAQRFGVDDKKACSFIGINTNTATFNICTTSNKKYEICTR